MLDQDHNNLNISSYSPPKLLAIYTHYKKSILLHQSMLVELQTITILYAASLLASYIHIATDHDTYTCHMQNWYNCDFKNIL